MSNPLGAEAVALANLDPAYASHTEPDRRRPGNAFEHAAAEVLNWRSENIVAAGAELGLWMCLAFGLEVLGVQVRRCKAQQVLGVDAFGFHDVPGVWVEVSGKGCKAGKVERVEWRSWHETIARSCAYWGGCERVSRHFTPCHTDDETTTHSLDSI